MNFALRLGSAPLTNHRSAACSSETLETLKPLKKTRRRGEMEKGER